MGVELGMKYSSPDFLMEPGCERHSAQKIVLPAQIWLSATWDLYRRTELDANE